MGSKNRISVALVAVAIATNVYAGSSDSSEIQEAIQKVEPLTPQEIKVFKQYNAEVQKATSVGGLSNGETKSTIRAFKVGSGEAPPTITLVSGYATNISFVGQNGAPWPIEAIQSGDNGILAITKPGKDEVDNANLFVKKPYANTNFFAYLKGKPQPVLVYVKTKGDSANGLAANVVFHVDGDPPGTMPLPVKSASGVSDALLNATNYSPGPSWNPIKVKEGNNYPFQITVWKSSDNKKIIVRLVNGTLVSPSYAAESKSGDVSAYEFSYSPFLYTITDNGGSLYTVSLKDVTGQLASQNATPYLSVSQKTSASISFSEDDHSSAVNEFQQIMYDENPDKIQKLASGSNLFSLHHKGGAVLLRWTFTKGSLKKNIQRLAKEYGYQKVVWKASNNPILPNDITISGKTLSNILNKLLYNHNLEVQLYKNGVMVVVNG